MPHSSRPYRDEWAANSWQAGQSPIQPPVCASQTGKSVPHSSRLYRDEWAANSWQAGQSPIQPPVCASETGKSVPHSSRLYRDEWAANSRVHSDSISNDSSDSGSVVVEAAPSVLFGRCDQSPFKGGAIATQLGSCPKTRSSRSSRDERGTVPDARMNGSPA